MPSSLIALINIYPLKTPRFITSTQTSFLYRQTKPNKSLPSPQEIIWFLFAKLFFPQTSISYCTLSSPAVQVKNWGVTFSLTSRSKLSTTLIGFTSKMYFTLFLFPSPLLRPSSKSQPCCFCQLSGPPTQLLLLNPFHLKSFFHTSQNDLLKMEIILGHSAA